jgi:hypothetical protein
VWRDFFTYENSDQVVFGGVGGGGGDGARGGIGSGSAAGKACRVFRGGGHGSTGVRWGWVVFEGGDPCWRSVGVTWQVPVL